MDTIKTVLISTAALPHEGIASWTTELNYLLQNENELDYVIGPYSNIKISKPIQIFIDSTTLLDKLKGKFNFENRFNPYIRGLKKVLKLEDKILLQVKDNYGLLKYVLKFISKNNLRKRVYVQYHYHSFFPFTTDAAILKQIDELILLTEPSYEVFKKTCNELPVKIKINNDGVDSNLFKPVDKNEKKELRERLNLNKENLIFIWCSQDRKKKGLDLIIEVWKKIYENNNKIELLIFGVNKTIDSKGVKVMGKVPNSELANYHQASDFYLFPTLWQEGFGLSLVEAMKSGSYCISALNGSTEYVLQNGSYGRLVERPNMISSWVETIEKAIQEYENDDRLNPYSKNIPSNIYDMHDWYLRYNTIIDEAKKSFNCRYYI